MSVEPTLFLVDDDPSTRESLLEIARKSNIQVLGFECADDFLAFYVPDTPGCLVLDFQLPDIDGLQLQKKLNQKKCNLPIIFLTAHANIELSVQAMKEGAFEFLEKPCCPEHFINAVKKAMEKNWHDHNSYPKQEQAKALLQTLTPEEKKVLDLIISGRINQEIANSLGISLRTVQFRRTSIFTKLGVQSKSDLFDLFNIRMPSDFQGSE